MPNRKEDRIQFLKWMRNGTAFCTTWFLILILVYNYLCGIQSILTMDLIKMVFWIIGGVFLFNCFFTRLIIKKWHFIARLSCFMVVISVYECLGFYWFGLFSGAGSIIQWFVFSGIILTLYLICIAIYQRYSKRQGEIYTQALRNYQTKRSMQNEQ